MTTVAYADATALEEFTGTDAPEGAARLLARASELLDDRVRRTFTVDDDTDLPTDTDIAAALSDAACAQVEYWVEVGEEHDVEGLSGVGIAVGTLRLDQLPPELAPRARRILRTAGLLDAPGGLSTADQFFATQVG